MKKLTYLLTFVMILGITCISATNTFAASYNLNYTSGQPDSRNTFKYICSVTATGSTNLTIYSSTFSTRIAGAYVLATAPQEYFKDANGKYHNTIQFKDVNTFKMKYYKIPARNKNVSVTLTLKNYAPSLDVRAKGSIVS